MADNVAFNTIPADLLVPFAYFEINSGGSPYSNLAKHLIVGQKLSGGAATAGVPYGPIQGPRDAIKQFGQGSMLHSQFIIARRNAPTEPIWALPLADPAGAAATGTLTITAPGETGPGIVEVEGRRITIQVNASDTAAAVASRLATAINAAYLPVTAAAGSSPNTHVVTVTSRHVGAAGNATDLWVVDTDPNVFTASNCVVVAMSGGSGVPDLATPLANLGDEEYDWITGPYSDTTSLNTIRDFLNGTSGRWSPFQQLYGHYTTAKFDTLSNLVTFGNGRNDPHVSIVGSPPAPTPPWEFAAAVGGQEHVHLSNPPEMSRPLHTLTLEGVKPPRDRSLWFDIPDRQALYADGISATKVTRDGLVVIDRIVTTYQEFSAGVPDSTFRAINTVAQSMWAARYFRVTVSNRHGRTALADENPYNLAEITTPNDLRNTCIHAYQDLVALGLAENADLFAKFVVVKRNSQNPNRADAYLPLDVVNQLDIFAGNLTIFQQYNTASGQAQVAQ